MQLDLEHCELDMIEYQLVAPVTTILLLFW